MRMIRAFCAGRSARSRIEIGKLFLIFFFALMSGYGVAERNSGEKRENSERTIINCFFEIRPGFGFRHHRLCRFLNGCVINFLAVSWFVFWIVKASNKLKRNPPPSPAATPEDVLLLREIRDSLKK